MVLRICSYGKPTLTMLTVKDAKTVGDLMADVVSLVFIFKQGLVILTGGVISGHDMHRTLLRFKSRGKIAAGIWQLV